MKKQYPQRAASVSKHSEYVEQYGFNINNVIFDQKTSSPRLLTSFAESGMRRLTETEKRLHADEINKKRIEGQKHQKPQQIIEKSKNFIFEQPYDQRHQISRVLNPFGDQNTKNNKQLLSKKTKKENYTFIEEELKKQKQINFVSKQVQNYEEVPKSKDSLTESTDNLLKMVIEQSKQEPKNSELLLRMNEMENRFDRRLQSIQKFMHEKNSNILDKTSDQPMQNIQISMHQNNNRNKNIQEMLRYLCQNIKKEPQKEENYSFQNEQLKQQLKTIQKRYRQLQEKFAVYRKEVEDTCQKQKQQLQSKIKSQYLEIATLEQNIHKSDLQNKQIKQREVVQFYSELVITSNISSFLKESIQKFTKRNLNRAKLIYQKDKWNTNISNYIERLPFNALILMRTNKGCIFGVFTEGIQTYVTNRLKEEKNFKPFRAFLFNATTKKIFAREEKGQQSKVKLCGVSYHDNCLRFGNNEVSIKNNNLGQANIAGYIFGEKYFNIQKRQILTGQEGEVVELADLQIFELFIQ